MKSKRYVKIAEADIETFRHLFGTIFSHYEEMRAEIQTLQYTMERIERQSREQKIIPVDFENNER